MTKVVGFPSDHNGLTAAVRPQTPWTNYSRGVRVPTRSGHGNWEPRKRSTGNDRARYSTQVTTQCSYAVCHVRPEPPPLPSTLWRRSKGVVRLSAPSAFDENTGGVIRRGDGTEEERTTQGARPGVVGRRDSARTGAGQVVDNLVPGLRCPRSKPKWGLSSQGTSSESRGEAPRKETTEPRRECSSVATNNRCSKKR